ncbi:MAG: TenA family transcriptional regulator [Pseudomonadota bacterium]
MPAPAYKKKLELTEHPEWVTRYWDEMVPLKDRVARHPLFVEMGEGTLSLERFRCALLNFYPLVENFPKYMGLNLAKTRPGLLPGHEEAKNWLIENIKVELRHAYWYQDWAAGFGISRDTLARVQPPPAMDAVNHFLWDIGRSGSLAEGIAATNLAIEWATGEWSKFVARGMQAYAERGVATVNRHTMAWLNAHASYDDAHPYEALELVKRIAVTAEERSRVFEATRRGLDYYALALEHCYHHATD